MGRTVEDVEDTGEAVAAAQDGNAEKVELAEEAEGNGGVDPESVVNGGGEEAEACGDEEGQNAVAVIVEDFCQGVLEGGEVVLGVGHADVGQAEVAEMVV